MLDEPGNLIANPGFEVDSTDDGLPDDVGRQHRADGDAERRRALG